MYLFCIYTPHPRCWVAMLGRGLSLLWAGTGWESCAAGQVSEPGVHWTKLANSTAHREEKIIRSPGSFFFLIKPSNHRRQDDVLLAKPCRRHHQSIADHSALLYEQQFCRMYFQTVETIDNSQSKLSCSLLPFLRTTGLIISTAILCNWWPP